MAIVRYTKKASLNGREIARFPLILKDNGIVHWWALDYFLDLRRQGSAVSSIATYASHLGDFIAQLEIDGRQAHEIDDSWLEAYRDSILDRGARASGKNTMNYTGQVVRSVIAYLYWLETNEYVSGLIGNGKEFPIRIAIGRHGIKHWLVKSSRFTDRPVVAPRASWIAAIKPYGPKRDDLSERFELMIDWGSSAGLRAMEICYLCVSQLPDEQSTQRALEDEELLYVRILVSKGARESTIPVSPLLVKKTWQYVNTSRQEVVNRHCVRAKEKYETYVDPDFLFLSDGTGTRMDPGALSNSVRSAYKAAVNAGDLTEEQRVWLHGLRHNFATTLLRKLDKEGVKRPEAVARQATRHGSEEAMDPYLSERFNEAFDGET